MTHSLSPDRQQTLDMTPPGPRHWWACDRNHRNDIPTKMLTFDTFWARCPACVDKAVWRIEPHVAEDR